MVINIPTQKGFTLTELLTGMVITAILVAVTLPSFRQALVRHRIASITTNFMDALTYARTEAIKSNRHVALRKTNTNWEDGWKAFKDEDNDGMHDSGETLLREWPALPDNFTLRPNNNFSNYVSYNARGEANNIGSFAVCYKSRENRAKVIIITRLRPRFGTDSDNDDVPETDSGNIKSCENP